MADALRHVAREVASSTLASSIIPSGTIASNEPAMTQPSPTITVSPSSSTPTGDHSVTQNPLLFFVALGFGVVFTNLWIIVGVKYCFRYNARNRALAMQANGEGIDLQNVTPTPRRRRRERKLLSMEEVNRQFPLQKYGTWMAGRQAQGLPAEGGVDGANAAAVVERAKSLRNADGAVEGVSSSTVRGEQDIGRETGKVDTTQISAAPASPTTQREAIDITTAPEKAPDTVPQTLESHENAADPHILAKYQTNNTINTVDPKNSDADRHSDNESDDEDAFHAIHPDVTDHPGDSCAICIDDLGDDEDIRGLTCGHAFHASCIDPWLTSRRACCPLCKRDYWVPKPRAEGEGEETSDQRRQRRREREERRALREANTVWAVRGTRIYLPGRFLGGGVGPLYVREGFAGRSPGEVRRRERADVERERRRVEERRAETLQRRAQREQARQEREAARAAAGGSSWRSRIPFGRGGNEDSEARAGAQPQNAAEAQVMAQARGQTGSQQQGGGFIARLNPFGRSVGGNAEGAGQAQAGEQQQGQPTPGQVEAQTETLATRSRGWIFR